jgi:hypothetical protein
VEATFIEAPTTSVGGIAPQRIRHGDVLGFYVEPGTMVEVISESTNGSVLIGPNGCFSYEPAENDRAPFEVRFTLGGQSQTVIVTPVQDLPGEQTILALEPVVDPPSSSGRDYTFIHSEEAAEGVNYNTAENSREITVSGVSLIFEETGDPQLYELVHDKENISKLSLYADEVIVRSPLNLPGTDVQIYARRLVFENEDAVIDTSAIGHTVSDGGSPQQGGDIRLHVLEILSDPSPVARIATWGADTETDARGGDSGKLTGPFDLGDFADIRGGTSSGGDSGSALPVSLHEEGGVPEGLATVLDVTNLALEYKAADYDQKAQEIDDELKSDTRSESEIERDELRGKAENMRSAASGVSQAGSALKNYLASQEVPVGEIAAELEKIRASDPQFNGVIAHLQGLMDEKERFARRIASLEYRLREIPGIILKNRIAMITLGDAIDQGNVVLEPQALSVVKEMEARNKDRLRRYFYLLAKSFEYRLLEPYREEENFQDYDPVKVLDKVKEILIASQSGESADTEGHEHHVLSATGFQTLRSVLEEELSLLSDRIITGYGSGDEREETFAYDALLREDELEELGESGSPMVLNLHKRRVYPAGEEAHRIAALRVTNSDFVMMIGDELVEADDPRLENLSSLTIDLLFEHSGLTRLSRKGQTYFFNHFRDGDPSKNPIRWTAKVNLFSGAVSMVRPSVASQSLLGTLLGTENQLDVLNFSWPGANADIFLTTQNLNGGSGILPDDFRVRFTRIDLVAQLDYYQTSADQLVDVRVTDPDGAALNIKPRILFDDADAPDQMIVDEYGRRDSLGAVSRSFPDVNRLKITAEAFYGSELAAGNAFPSGYRFVRWAGATSTTNEVIMTNDGVKRLLAIYERVGDVEAPEIKEVREVSTQGNIVTYEVTFSEDVVGVDVTDFVIGESTPGAGV